jgi:hypothetical protein
MKTELERCLMARSVANALVNLVMDVLFGKSAKLNDSVMEDGIVKNVVMSSKFGSTEWKSSVPLKMMGIHMSAAI